MNINLGIKNILAEFRFDPNKGAGDIANLIVQYLHDEDVLRRKHERTLEDRVFSLEKWVAERRQSR